ncbi:MAG: pantetheine-phosphate adenylyltransferase [Schleiferiaceae bacterium]|jgi:pantetheine-phosphate adenylyltransferase|nr:pantetheine-phosphate adenylyltransferase [Schleiferiaceae bacterium]MDO7583670.1 pantetheine-phosphate adenylyltransferase [Schleiferiaceae bacterium]MDO7593593.1 pantetheine-phosphate adenylyltransferase [Schleiferiaceae bacterium]MDO7602237.1 pantetheine-phosphate adenylyltransferase [Schleiferiaceae bacterium]MDO7620864.1 pantetheine-phosphate adenylyltransferase [Schleiferiaceae bacterium]
MAKIALFPGSFDPITLGHRDIIERALPLFDEILIAIGENNDKTYLFDLHQRVAWIEGVFAHEPKIRVVTYQGLTAAFAKENNIQFLLRGLRNPSDFEFEKSIAQANRQMESDLETVFLLTSARYSYISSSIVREVIRHGGDYKVFVPDSVRIA